MKLINKRLALRGEPSFEPGRAVAVAAGPGFAAVFVAAVLSGVGVLHFDQLKIRFPVRSLFLEWRRAVTDFHPASRAVGQLAGIGHVAQIFAFGHRALTDGFGLDGVEQGGFLPRLYACFDEVSHGAQ